MHWSAEHKWGQDTVSKTCRYPFCLFVKYSTVHICIRIWFAGWVEQLSSSSLRLVLCLLMCESIDSSSGVFTKQTTVNESSFSEAPINSLVIGSSIDNFLCSIVLSLWLDLVSQLFWGLALWYDRIMWIYAITGTVFFKMLNLNQPRASRGSRI